MLILTGSIGAEIEHNNTQGNHGSIEMRNFFFDALRVCQMSKIRINHKQFSKNCKATRLDTQHKSALD